MKNNRPYLGAFELWMIKWFFIAIVALSPILLVRWFAEGLSPPMDKITIFVGIYLVIPIIVVVLFQTCLAKIKEAIIVLFLYILAYLMIFSSQIYQLLSDGYTQDRLIGLVASAIALSIIGGFYFFRLNKRK